MTELRILTPYNLRRVCVENNWYTCGDCEDYQRLFDRLKDENGDNVHMSVEKLEEIATDIMEHSDIGEYGTPEIMCGLCCMCTSIFYNVETA